MSLADDPASPAAPFYGDETGAIFDAPDLVLQSPTTTERVVDTQSGFLVVVRRIGARSALSVKRRLGTPPVSSILLTPDESLQLAKILSGAEPVASQSKATAVSSNLDEWNNRFNNDALQKEPPQLGPDRGSSRMITAEAEPRNRRQRAILLSIVAIAALSTGMLLASHWRARQSKKAALAETKTIQTTVGSQAEIDKFVRNYVSNMLDFSPETYKFSQIQAMSVMTPQLMSKYWQETNFPIAEKQLKSGMKRETFVITKVVQQEPLDNSTRIVDVFAQLNGSDGKSSVPTHLRLKLSVSANQPDPIAVSEQNDLTASDK